MTPAAARLRDRIRAEGPQPFGSVMDLALYDPEVGFYATTGRAGRRGDFVTSPEVGPLFGAVVARAVDAWWDEAGRPARWTVVDAGAGPGSLARGILAAGPRCLPALRLVLVERSPAQRSLHADLAERWPGKVASTAALPDDPPAVVLANELLDNLPVDLLERTEAGWSEVVVDLAGEDLVEVHGPLRHDVPEGAAGARAGARVPVQAAAAAWVAEAVALARDGGGRVVVLDYATTTAALVERPRAEWLRTYRRHDRGAGPLEDLGEQDITCEVCVDQLAPPPDEDVAQADWLRRHGIDELVEDGRRTWDERAAIGDLAAVRGRSRVTEAAALLDPAGLGGFRVLAWG